VLAVQQGDHTLEYMDFRGKIPSGYGAGTVKRHLRDQAEVFHADPDKIKFNHYRGSGHDEYILRRTKDKNWLLQNVTRHSGRTPAMPKPKYKEEKREAQLTPEDEGKVWAPKADGSHNVFVLEKGRPIRAFSHRPAKARRTGLIEHSHKVPGLMDKKVPSHLDGTIVRGEIFARPHGGGRPLPAERVSGLLNAGVWKSRKGQEEHGPLEVMTFDVARYRGKDMSAAPYSEKLRVLKQVQAEFPGLKRTPVARTKSEKLQMLEAIRRKEHPLTDEGIVEWDLAEGTRPKKYKFKPDEDLEIVGFFKTKGGKYEGTHVGGVLVKDPKGNVSRVGTGFTDDFRRLAHEKPELLIGRTAKITSMGKYPSGKLRIPSFQGLHPEKNDPDDLKKLEEAGVTLEQMTRTKKAHITILTGGMGAGKSTWAEKHRGKFDLVLGTDTGSPDGKGGYSSPSKETRDRIRQEKDEQALAAHRAGKRVLLEGFPKGILQHPRSLAAADQRLVMGTGPVRRLFRVAKRSRQRGTSTLEDLAYAAGTFKTDRESYRKIKEHGPLTKVASALLRGKTAALLPLNKPVVVSKTKQKHIDSWEKRKGKEDLVSTNLGTVAYNPSRKTMHVEFAKGGLYRYSGVSPETYAGVLKAKSHGKHFHKHVKEPGFRYRRLV